jgi:hypothetical protein
MRTFPLLILIINISATIAQKAFVPINFGMTKQGVREAVKAAPSMKMFTGATHRL